MADGWITPPDVLTEAEVADYLRADDRRTITRLRQAGDLVGFRVGKTYRYRLDAVRDFITRQEQKETR